MLQDMSFWLRNALSYKICPLVLLLYVGIYRSNNILAGDKERALFFSFLYTPRFWPKNRTTGHVPANGHVFGK